MFNHLPVHYIFLSNKCIKPYLRKLHFFVIIYIIKNILQNQQLYDRNAYKYPQNELGLWLWHLVPLSTIFQLFE